MLILTPEPGPTPRKMDMEHCCFCRQPTNLWYTPKDVAVCQDCGITKDPKDVPTKKEWFQSEKDFMASKGCY